MYNENSRPIDISIVHTLTGFYFIVLEYQLDEHEIEKGINAFTDVRASIEQYFYSRLEFPMQADCMHIATALFEYVDAVNTMRIPKSHRHISLDAKKKFTFIMLSKKLIKESVAVDYNPYAMWNYLTGR